MRFRTKNNWYTLVDQGDGAFLISGNAKYCPTPTPCTLSGRPIEVGSRVWFTPLNRGCIVALFATRKAG